MMSYIRYGWARRGAMAAAVAIGVSASGCGLLDVSDPTQIGEDEIQNAAGAELQRVAAMGMMWRAVGSQAYATGLFTDEFRYDATAGELTSPSLTRDIALDRRESLLLEPLSSYNNMPYVDWQTARRSVMTALPGARAYMVEPARSAYVGQLLTARGFAELNFAETFCPGFPLNDLVGGNVVRNGPKTTSEAFEQALADFDSAIVSAADSARFRNWARVGKGRALLGLGRFDEAGQAVTDVETTYQLNAEFSSSGAYQPNPMQTYYSNGNSNRTVGDSEGGVGLDFVSAHDPRVPAQALGPALYNGDSIYSFPRYQTETDPIIVASGIEARLIQAEAAFHTGGDWRGILNDLRESSIAPPMSQLLDPGTDAARVDLIFRERAFWLFGTGHRLADIRRLIAYYGRDPETIFPTGVYVPAGLYNTATSLAYPQALEQRDDPRLTGCITR